MCLAIPMKIASIDGMNATATAGGSTLAVNVMLLDGITVGDYVLVHAGFAIRKIDEDEANETIKILNAIVSSPLRGEDQGGGD